MRVIVQRVSQASVRVDTKIVGEIGQGLLVFVCSQTGDTEAVITRMLQKILKLRVFSDDAGKMNLSLQDVGGGLLLVSQFTLAADVSRGNRPSFTAAAAPDRAITDFERLIALAKAAHPVVQSGVFGANMMVSLVNDGPVTIPIEINRDA